MLLHSIVDSKNIKQISKALQDGVDVDALNDSNITPLMRVCCDGGVKAFDIISLLIDAGANIYYVRESDGMTALKFAAKTCSGKCIEKLITAGALPDEPKGTKQTALMLAARANNIHAIDMLARHGADLDYPCGLPWAKGKNALWLAEKEKCRKAVKRLKEIESGVVVSQQGVVERNCSDLLAELDAWLQLYRKGYYKKLIIGVNEESIKNFETLFELRLPEGFKAMIRWKNGQKKSVTETFHPCTNEMFMTLSSIETTIISQNELLEYGDIDENYWRKYWLPFMDNGGGDYTCLDLSSKNYGKIIRQNHEIGDGSIIFESLSEWLIDLLGELNTLDFDGWDFDRGA